MGSAFLSALYLAAMSLYAGPTNFLSAAWHARQFFCFANSALATAGPAIVSMPHAPTKAAAANFVFIIAPYVDIADKFNGNTTDWLTSNTPRIGLDRRLYLRSVTFPSGGHYVVNLARRRDDRPEGSGDQRLL